MAFIRLWDTKAAEILNSLFSNVVHNLDISGLPGTNPAIKNVNNVTIKAAWKNCEHLIIVKIKIILKTGYFEAGVK